MTKQHSNHQHLQFNEQKHLIQYRFIYLCLKLQRNYQEIKYCADATLRQHSTKHIKMTLAPVSLSNVHFLVGRLYSPTVPLALVSPINAHFLVGRLYSCTYLNGYLCPGSPYYSTFSCRPPVKVYVFKRKRLP
jgi:hypothetical protein